MSNKNNTVLYIGATSELKNRVFEHKSKIYPSSFTAKYNCDKLVYFETFQFIEEAIDREKRLKGGSRKEKNKLVNDFNPDWKDLVEEIED